VTPEGIHAFHEETSEVHLRLRRLKGWVEGLINELLLTQRLRLEAEARVRIELATPDGSRARDAADVEAALRARLEDSRGRE